jgi:hypothetical protein
MDDGRRYSVAPSAIERAAWRVLREICPAPSKAKSALQSRSFRSRPVDSDSDPEL